MKNKEYKAIITAALFYGSLWGIAEAVLGYFLHMLPFGMSAFIMFPIGFFFMERGYRQTRRAGTAFCIGAIAAAVKLADLFLPFMPVIKTINPAISITLESLAVMAGIMLFAGKGRTLGLSGSLFVSISWRIVYASHAFVLTLFSIPSNIFKESYMSLLDFLLVEGMINAGIIYSYLKIKGRFEAPVASGHLYMRPLVSASLFAAAVLTNIVFSIL